MLARLGLGMTRDGRKENREMGQDDPQVWGAADDGERTDPDPSAAGSPFIPESPTPPFNPLGARDLTPPIGRLAEGRRTVRASAHPDGVPVPLGAGAASGRGGGVRQRFSGSGVAAGGRIDRQERRARAITLGIAAAAVALVLSSALLLFHPLALDNGFGFALGHHYKPVQSSQVLIVPQPETTATETTTPEGGAPIVRGTPTAGASVTPAPGVTPGVTPTPTPTPSPTPAPTPTLPPVYATATFTAATRNIASNPATMTACPGCPDANALYLTNSSPAYHSGYYPATGLNDTVTYTDCHSGLDALQVLDYNTLRGGFQGRTPGGWILTDPFPATYGSWICTPHICYPGDCYQAPGGEFFASDVANGQAVAFDASAARNTALNRLNAAVPAGYALQSSTSCTPTYGSYAGGPNVTVTYQDTGVTLYQWTGALQQQLDQRLFNQPLSNAKTICNSQTPGVVPGSCQVTVSYGNTLPGTVGAFKLVIN